MILQDDGLSIAKVLCDPLTFFAIQDDTTELRIDSMVLVEPQAILRNHIELSAKNAEGFAVDAVRVACEASVTFQSAHWGQWLGSHAAWTSGLALWISEWIANAAALMGSSPTTILPSSSTKIKSDTEIWEKCFDRGFNPSGINQHHAIYRDC